MTAVAIAVTMAVMDGTLINLALPTIARDLAVSPSVVVWVVSAYQLTIALSLFPLSALGEKIGYRRVYCGGLILFTIASAACAMAASAPALITARILQGLGASGIMCVNIALIRFIYPKQSLGRGIGYNTLIVALSATAGPSVAAALLSVAAWPWLFAVNLPLGIAALAVGAWALPTNPLSSRRFDGTGALLTAVAIGTLVLAIDGFGRSQTWTAPASLFALSLLLLVWLYRDQRAKPHPVIPIDLLKVRLVGLSSATALASYVVQSLCYIALPFYFHGALGFGLVAVGVLMTPWPLAIAFVSPLAGRLSDRFPPGILGTIGLVLLALGIASLVLLPADPSVLNILWRMGVCGLGFGLFQAPNSRAIVSGSPIHRSGAASALQSAARLIGQTIGAALVASLFALFPQSAATACLQLAVVFALVAALTSSLRMRPATPDEAAQR
nr:MFS transporter [Microvirga antarctica]